MVRIPHWLRRPLGLAFVLVLVTLAARTCESESVTAEIRFDAGDAARQVQGLRADLFREGERDGVGYFESSSPGGASGVIGPWKLSADAGKYRLAIELQTPAGPRQIERTIAIEDRARVTVDLERDLTP